MKTKRFWIIVAALLVLSLTAAPLQAQEPDPAPAPTEEEKEIEEAIDEAADEVWVDTGRQMEPEPEPEVVIIEQEPKMDNRPQRREVKTLMSPGSGGFGAISLGYTQVNGLDGLEMGARAEWVIGHGFGLGIAGTGFTSDFTSVDSDYYAISGGYGGLVMEPIIMGWLPLHIALPVVIGGGGLASYATNADPWNYDSVDPTFGEYAVFFIVEAGAELEFNLTRFFRLALYGTYRWTTPLEMKAMYGLSDPSPYAVDPHALWNWSAGVRFKFGSF